MGEYKILSCLTAQRGYYDYRFQLYPFFAGNNLSKLTSKRNLIIHLNSKNRLLSIKLWQNFELRNNFLSSFPSSGHCYFIWLPFIRQ